MGRAVQYCMVELLVSGPQCGYQPFMLTNIKIRFSSRSLIKASQSSRSTQSISGISMNSPQFIADEKGRWIGMLREAVSDGIVTWRPRV